MESCLNSDIFINKHIYVKTYSNMTVEVYIKHDITSCNIIINQISLPYVESS